MSLLTMLRRPCSGWSADPGRISTLLQSRWGADVPSRAALGTCVDAPGNARRIFGLVQRVVRADMCAASNAALHMPRARMGVRGSGPNQIYALEALVPKLVCLIPSR